jgi:4-carboxymuconolactone decarboxylase
VSPRFPAHFPAAQPTPSTKVNRVSSFTVEGKDGGLLGPLSIMMYTPGYATHVMRLNGEVLNLPALEPVVVEVAILATGGHFTRDLEGGGGFLTYSHSRIAAKKKLLTEEQMVKINQGEKPQGLSEKAGMAFDLAIQLVKGGKPLEQALWEQANAILGKDQTLHVIQLVAFYSLQGVMLSAGLIGAPEGERIWK